MTIKVIGAGFGRTGTLSLKVALETLGFSKCYHMSELLAQPEQVEFWEAASAGKPVDWNRLFAGYQATVDFPGYRFYRVLMEHYPEARVVLTVRDPEEWYESAFSTIYRAGPSRWQKFLMLFQLPFSAHLRRMIRVFRLAQQTVWSGDFQGKFEDRQFAIAEFHRHIAEVRHVVPPNRLLVYDVREGWGTLCNFLGVPIPAGMPFPRLNDRSTFQQASRQLIQSQS